MSNKNNLFIEVKKVIDCCDIDQKINLVDQLIKKWRAFEFELTSNKTEADLYEPGRPDKPVLVHPKYLPKRKIVTNDGKAALMHAIAHIEFNAINLALDAVYQFQSMPSLYYQDWLDVAAEECYHFQLIQSYLYELGFKYGDFEGHNALWAMAQNTAYDVLARMALVPRVLEARGLDATPEILKKLLEAGDQKAVDILMVIERDEIGHVAKGSYWFKYCCKQRGLAPLSTFQQLITKHVKGGFKKPFATQSRKKAGFSEQELDWLDSIAL